MMYQLVKRWDRDSHNPRFVVVNKVKGSPAFSVQEAYQCEDAPSGYYTCGDYRYISGPEIRTHEDALTEVLRLSAPRYRIDRDLTEAFEQS